MFVRTDNYLVLKFQILQCRNLIEQDLYNEDLMDKFAYKVAMLHHQDLPVDKTLWTQCLKSISDELDDQYVSKLKEMSNERGLKELSCYDYKKELQWIIDSVHTFGSPVVFGQQVHLCEVIWYKNSGDSHRIVVLVM